MSAADVLVIGDGVVAWTCALELARRGRQVVVTGAGDASASAAAAGMIAPASEAVLDAAESPTAELWRRAGAAWRGFAAELGVTLRTEGALHIATVAELERRAAAAERLGFQSVLTREGLHLPEDASLEPAQALAALRRAAGAAGVVFRSGRASAAEGRLRIDGAPAPAVLTLIAAGWGAAALREAAPELGALSPIRGQLLQIRTAEAAGPVVRAPGAYLAPQPWGWAVGATMEPGRTDLAPDAAASAQLLAAAAAVKPQLAGAAAATPVVGVRSATRDGAPLVGPSCAPGVLLATGMRRNGWLLAPLVAQVIAAYEAGDPHAVLGGQAHAWDPARVLQTL